MSLLLTGVSEGEIAQRAQAAARRVTQDLIESESIEVSGPGEVVVRDILPQQDFESGDDNGYTTGGDPEWRQDWAAGGAGTDAFQEAYEIDSTNNADGKIIEIFGLQAAAGDIETRQWRAVVGTGATGGVLAHVGTEQLENDQEATGLLAQNVRFGPTANGSLQHSIENAVDNKRFRYLGVVGHATGEVVSFPSNPQVGPRQGQSQTVADGGRPLEWSPADARKVA